MKKTIADCPELIKEWHPTKNGDLMPCHVSYGSDKKVWWICSKGHEWQTSADKRTCSKTGCPYCVNQKVCKDNCLATLFPEIAKEWHPTKNGNITPHNIVAGSDKKYWWICSKGHEWQIGCGSRTGKKKTGCPYCSNQKICNDNCLATTHPEIAKEWHPTKNGKLTPSDVIVGSNKKYWWLCSKNHEWETSSNLRISQKTGCPCCANKKVCKDNCLATLFPEIAKEWHPTKNGDLTPNNIISQSNKKYWWLCSKNHEWKAICCNRTGKLRSGGCPSCSESKGEKEVAKILDELNISYRREFTFENCKNINKLRFDFVVNINNATKAIEYHGIQHYEPVNFGSSKNINNCKHKNLKNNQHRDEIKRDFCKSANIPLLEINYKDHNEIEKLIIKFLEI